MTNPALLSRFETFSDTRDPKKVTHVLAEVIFMATCAILCGADDWNSMRMFALTQEDWFRKHLSLPGGIPCAMTFNRLFRALDPEE